MPFQNETSSNFCVWGLGSGFRPWGEWQSVTDADPNCFQRAIWHLLPTSFRTKVIQHVSAGLKVPFWINFGVLGNFSALNVSVYQRNPEKAYYCVEPCRLSNQACLYDARFGPMRNGEKKTKEKMYTPNPDWKGQQIGVEMEGGKEKWEKGREGAEIKRGGKSKKEERRGLVLLNFFQGSSTTDNHWTWFIVRFVTVSDWYCASHDMKLHHGIHILTFIGRYTVFETPTLTITLHNIDGQVTKCWHLKASFVWVTLMSVHRVPGQLL